MQLSCVLSGFLSATVVLAAPAPGSKAPLAKRDPVRAPNSLFTSLLTQ